MDIESLPDLALIKIIDNIGLRDRITLESETDNTRIIKILHSFWRQKKKLKCRDLSIQGNFVGLPILEFVLNRIGDNLESIDFSECLFRMIDRNEEIDPVTPQLSVSFLELLTLDLTELILRGVQLNAETVRFIARLVNLRTLDLNFSYRASSEEGEDIEDMDDALRDVFEHCSRLQTLHFSLHFPCIALASLPLSLTKLVLVSGHTTGRASCAPVVIPEGVILRLPSLTCLKLGVIHLQFPLSIAALVHSSPNITELDVRKIHAQENAFPFTGIEFLPLLTCLTSLSLNFCYEDGSNSITAINCLSNSGLTETLTNLRFWRCRANKATLWRLTLFNKLEHLDLLRCYKIHELEIDECFNSFYCAFSNLMTLSLVGTQISNTTLKAVSVCPKLSNLDIRLCPNISEDGLLNMKIDNRECKHLTIFVCGTQITDGKPSEALNKMMERWKFSSHDVIIDPFSWPKWNNH